MNLRFVLVFAALTACSGGDDTGKAAEDTDLPAPDPNGDVRFEDANNYSYIGILDAPSFAVAEQSDATLDWSALQTDLRCQALDPVADIDNVALLNFPYLTEVEVEDGLSDDTLDQADLRVYLSYEPGDGTTASLSQVSFFGTDPEIEPQFTASSGAWVMLLTTGTQLAVGTRMLAFLTPTAGETNTLAVIDDGCPVLDFSADLSSLRAVPVLAGGPWKLDWSALTRDGHGGTFEPTRVDSLMVARFDESVAELEGQFLDLESLAEATWEYTLSGGTAADLGTLSGPSEPFPGFTGEGVWVAALRCGTCPNPAPIFLTVLVPS